MRRRGGEGRGVDNRLSGDVGVVVVLMRCCRRRRHLVNVDENGSDAVSRRRPHARHVAWNDGAAQNERHDASVSGADPQSTGQQRRPWAMG